MKVEVVKEIRFAVVMYGGVSLAIYINGVAQELLRMVRATAISEKTGEFLFDEEKDNFNESEKSYRTLSYLLANPDLMEKFVPGIKDEESWKRAQTEIKLEINSRSSVKAVRFVVDIMSGSSAGGINAIYLSKALVSGQDISNLQDLWINEGNFSLLLNDENSIDGTKLKLSKEPASLFNSQRMYLKLLEAFDGMDSCKTSSKETMIDEVDLFVTLTDFWGLPIPVRLSDKIIYERNHRRRLHFKYRRDGINDFESKNYPFLAYAARCTSSFPVAFDPMKLSDTKAVLETMGDGKRTLHKTWSKYFPEERIRLDNQSIDWENRVFVDGGTLDNKPFGYAIEQLGQRQANVLIDRKLIYIEPKPDLDGGNQRVNWIHRPDAVNNTLNIVTALPGYETIREDLYRVLERNRLISKVNYIVSNAQKDEYHLLELIVKSREEELEEIISDNKFLIDARKNKEWSKLTIAEIARFKGQAIYPYYRLRMSALTDDLARLSTRRAGLEDNSDYYLAIRTLVRAWRFDNYNKDEDPQSDYSIPNFLYKYDFNYRLRRLRFVLQEADKLLAALDKINLKKSKNFANLPDEDLSKDKFSADLKIRRDLIGKLKADEGFQKTLREKNASQILRQRFPLIEDELFDPQEASPIMTIFEADKNEIESILRKLKKQINRHLKEISTRQQLIETRGIDPNLLEISKKLNKNFSVVAKQLTLEHLSELLGETSAANTASEYDLEASNKIGKKFLDEKPEIREGINSIAEALSQLYNGDTENDTDERMSIFGKIRQSKDILNPSEKNINPLEKAVCGYLFHFYKYFDSYDQIIFPITYETPIGEGNIVEVARISPSDAVNLIDEEKDLQRREKLAGDTFFSFSAFFAENWRKNDIMWGRLDAVERLAELIVPNNYSPDLSQFKKVFITETQRNILANNEKLFPQKTPDLVEYVKNEYKVDRTLDENAMMKATARAFAVSAKFMQSPTEKSKDGKIGYENPNRLLKYSADFIKPLARMIDVSTGGFSIRNIFSFLTAPFRLGWLTIPFIFLIFLLAGIWLLGYNVMTDVGIFNQLSFDENALDLLNVGENIRNVSSDIRSGIRYKWGLGFLFVAFFFYLIFFLLTFSIKHYIFQKLARKIIN